MNLREQAVKIWITEFLDSVQRPIFLNHKGKVKLSLSTTP